MPTNFPTGITSQGFPVPFVVRGTVFYVDSNNGSDTNSGISATKAYATVDKAIGKATANNDDLIVLLPGHAENLSSATIFQVDKAGLTFLGLGEGSRIPTFSSTAVGGTVNIDSADCSIKNIRLTANFATGSTNAIDLDANYCTLDGVQCRDTSAANEWLVHINVVAAATDLLVKNCSFIGLAGTMSSSIEFAGASTNCVIENNYINVDASDSVIDHDTTVDVGLIVRDNIIHNQDDAGAGSVCIEVEATSDAIIARNICTANHGDAVVLTGEAAWWSENYAGNTAGSSSAIEPAAGAVP